MGYRFSILIIAIGLAYAFLLFHFYGLQIEKGDYYLAQAALQYAGGGILEPARGMIYFTDKSDGRLPLALNKKFPMIYAVPKEIEDAQESSEQLAPILNIPAGDLIKKLSKKDDAYELLIRKADDALISAVDSQKIKGVHIGKLPARFYPFSKTAAHILGFVGPTKESDVLNGHYGLEEFYNSELVGSPGKLNEGKMIPPENGKDLFLTVDQNIQIEAERTLNNLIKNYKTKGGSIIVEDPWSGKILALTNLPDFDPNAYGGSEMQNFLNPAVQHIYEPGSVFKIFTMAAGIDSGKLTPETSFFDSGKAIVSGKKIENAGGKSYGQVTMTQVIENSINTGAVFAEKKIGGKIFKDYLLKFGLDEKTGIDLPGEVKGDLRTLYLKAPAVNFATASFGQGVAISAIELINGMAAIANGGNLMRPYLNSALEPQVVRRVVSGETAAIVTKMMIAAVDKAEVAKIKGYSIAGKTGTAQVPDFKNGGYTEKVINTYVGFGPTANPRFIILLKLIEPEGNPVAALTVVPSFRDLAQFILNYYNVPPDRL